MGNGTTLPWTSSVVCPSSGRSSYCSAVKSGSAVAIYGPSCLRRNPCVSLACQAIEDLDAALQRALVGGVAEAEVRVAAAEDAAGDEQQIVADRLSDELGAAAARRLREQVERPVRLDQFETILQGPRTIRSRLRR